MISTINIMSTMYIKHENVKTIILLKPNRIIVLVKHVAISNIESYNIVLSVTTWLKLDLTRMDLNA